MSVFLQSGGIPLHRPDGRPQWRLGRHDDSPVSIWQPRQIPAHVVRKRGGVDSMHTGQPAEVMLQRLIGALTTGARTSPFSLHIKSHLSQYSSLVSSYKERSWVKTFFSYYALILSTVVYCLMSKIPVSTC